MKEESLSKKHLFFEKLFTAWSPKRPSSSASARPPRAAADQAPRPGWARCREPWRAKSHPSRTGSARYPWERARACASPRVRACWRWNAHPLLRGVTLAPCISCETPNRVRRTGVKSLVAVDLALVEALSTGVELVLGVVPLVTGLVDVAGADVGRHGCGRVDFVCVENGE